MGPQSAPSASCLDFISTESQMPPVSIYCILRALEAFPRTHPKIQPGMTSELGNSQPGRPIEKKCLDEEA